MSGKNIWTIIKTRYRLSTKIQMNFELSFPKYLIGKCRFTAGNACEIRTQKVSPSIKGVVFSDTIPLSWFTSSVLIPWSKVVKSAVSDKQALMNGVLTTPMPAKLNDPPFDSEYCTLQLDDPQQVTIDLPWSKEFTDYVQTNKLFAI